MATPQDEVRPCMQISDTQLKLDQVQAAMKVMMERAQSISDTPDCINKAIITQLLPNMTDVDIYNP